MRAASLSHIRVLDLSRILAGPWASQTLGDLGADIIKIERLDGGDDTRIWGPPFLNNESAYFLSTNRNKKSVTIDFTRPEGQEIIRRLAMQSDVLIENFKVGGLAAYGLDYSSLSQLNPRLIYCSITGFGQSGPYAARAGYDALLQALGGFMSVTGKRAGTPGDGPQKVGVAVIDLLSGLYAATGILAALAAREKTGKGQHIDLALLDVEVACLANQAMNFLVTGESPACMGNAHPSIVPYQDFQTADGTIMIAVGNDTQFERFCDVLGCPGLAFDPAFQTNAARVGNREQLLDIVTPIMKRHTTRRMDNHAGTCLRSERPGQQRGASLPRSAGDRPADAVEPAAFHAWTSPFRRQSLAPLGNTGRVSLCSSHPWSTYSRGAPAIAGNVGDRNRHSDATRRHCLP